MNTVKIEICDNIGEIEQKLENFNVNNLLVLKKMTYYLIFCNNLRLNLKLLIFAKM